ncbi:MAG TPA: PKD domain-containing protein, partial [Bacteroidia bacterium]|nr:PKD domain-containing protein [Bacteroidia bacterium]
MMQKIYASLLVLAVFCLLGLPFQSKAACNAAFQSTMPNCPTVQFFDASTSNSGVITQWNWTFGDGGTSTQQNPTHTYTANGTYNVCLLIITQFGCGSQFCQTITINCVQPPQCQAAFSANLSGCPQILFTDLSTPSNGISSWSWSFGDGGTSTAQNPAHTYLTNGNYVVCLTIATPNQCTSTFCDTISITCNQPPQCQAAFSANLSGCPQILFTDLSTPSNGI